MEFLLSILGGLLPLWALIVYKVMGPYFGQLGIIGLASLVGFLSGMEIPMLMEGSKGKKGVLDDVVMFRDYLGCLLGALLFVFSLCFIKYIFYIGAVAAALNLLVVAMMGRYKFFSVILFGAIGSILYYLSSNYLMLYLGS